MTQRMGSFTIQHSPKLGLALIGLTVLLFSIQGPSILAAESTPEGYSGPAYSRPHLQGSPFVPADYTTGIVKQFEETSYYLKDIDFITTTVGWAVGVPHWDQAGKVYTGTVIKTSDGGDTWAAQDAGVSEMLWGVEFVDANNGWAVGTSGTILHTSDGGEHWITQTVATSDEFLGVVFTDASTGWATSVKPVHYDSWGEPDNWEAAIWHTSNGGETWVQQAVPSNASILHDVDFIDAQTGWAVGVKYIGDDQYGRPEHRAAIYHTADGGLTWNEQYSPELEISFTTVDFLDATNGWVAGFPTRSDLTGGFVFHTSDGGETWERQEPGGFFDPLWDVQFVDQNRGYVVGFNYIAAWGPPVWRTLDGGATWTKVLMVKHDAEGLFGVAVVGDQVIAVGDHDFVAKSTRAWDSCEWVPPEPPCHYCGCLFEQFYLNTHYVFHEVFFADETHGWAVGRRSGEVTQWWQVIFHTQDGGNTWETQYEHAPPLDGLFSYHQLDSVYFTDHQNGWAVGMSETYWNPDLGTSGGWEHHGAILHTTDGGLNWEEQGGELYDDWDLEFFAVQFLDSQNGWALAAGRFPSANIFLAHTTDGGTHWNWVDTEIEGHIKITLSTVQGDVVFTDEQHGWAVGGLGEVIHTDDGGAHWVKQELSCGYPSCPIRCFAVEFVDNQVGWIAGEQFYHTTDSGAQWLPQDIGVGGDLQDIQFLDDRVGWLAGERGVLMYTSDGGNRWHELESGTPFALRGLFFVNPTRGWIVGDYGTILSYEADHLPIESDLFLPLVIKS